MVKHVLVPTDGSEAACCGVRYAVALAKKYGATLHGLHVVDVKLLEGPFLRDISASLGTAPYANYQGNIALLLEERGNAALEYVKQQAEAAGLKCDAEQVTGLVVRTIVEKAELADLVVMGRSGEHREWLEGLVGSTTQGVVRRSNQPVLVTARDLPQAERFLTAYDGSNNAKQALHVAAAFASDWHAPLTVLTVGGQRMDAVLDDARCYLDAHELTIEYQREDGDPSETIVAQAKRCGAGLLIMGAHGHTKVRELVVGSTTAYAMNHAPCPMLLAR